MDYYTFIYELYGQVQGLRIPSGIFCETQMFCFIGIIKEYEKYKPLNKYK